MATCKEYFVYNDVLYNKGTKVKFTGIIEKYHNIVLNFVEEEIEFLRLQQNACCVWEAYIKYKDEVYWCTEKEFIDGIVSIGIPINQNRYKRQEDQKQIDTAKEYYTTYEEKPKEIIWDDWMVAKTLWYIFIMALATIFHGRIGIWILATYIWYTTTIQNAPRA